MPYCPAKACPRARQSGLEQRLQGVPPSSEAQDRLWASTGMLEARYLRFLRTPKRIEDFETIKTSGKGAFGEVKLVRRREDRKVFALKSLRKSQMIAQLQLANVRAERDILAAANSPWVVKLYVTFQDAKFLYMLMEFVPGGDLMTVLIKYEYFNEDITRFCVAEMVMAIDAVHKLGVIHRDVKPDNILLDRDGHLKLTDFGLSTGFRPLLDKNYYQQLLQGTSTKTTKTQNQPNQQKTNKNNQNTHTVSNRSQVNEWRRSRR